METARPAPLITGRPPIGGYGKGGFRAAGQRIPGSILILPEGVFSWPLSSMAEVTPESFAPVWEAAPRVGFLLLGTGNAQIFPNLAIREAFAAANLGLDAMDTGAACRTYNVLLGEERVFAAALIAMPV